MWCAGICPSIFSPEPCLSKSHSWHKSSTCTHTYLCVGSGVWYSEYDVWLIQFKPHCHYCLRSAQYPCMYVLVLSINLWKSASSDSDPNFRQSWLFLERLHAPITMWVRQLYWSHSLRWLRYLLWPSEVRPYQLVPSQHEFVLFFQERSVCTSPHVSVWRGLDRVCVPQRDDIVVLSAQDPCIHVLLHVVHGVLHCLEHVPWIYLHTKGFDLHVGSPQSTLCLGAHRTVAWAHEPGYSEWWRHCNLIKVIWNDQMPSRIPGCALLSWSLRRIASS